MILSRTLEGPPNLSLMTLEARNASPIYDPVSLFEDLKKTSLYDGESGQWNILINARQELLDTNRYTDAQLLSLLVISEIRQHSLKESYETLKGTQFYNKQKKSWNFKIENRQDGESLVDTSVHLLDVLVISKFDKKTAKGVYDALRDTSLYDQDLDQWNWLMRFDGSLATTRYAYTQLMAILVLSEFNLDAAKESYLKLQSTILYDKERKQWNNSMMADQARKNPECHARDQLIDVLVLSNFDIEKAKCTYDKLKKTPLYDGNQRLWNVKMNANQKLGDSDRGCYCQLLAVLVEAKLAKAFPPETLLAENLPPLPDIWRGK